MTTDLPHACPALDKLTEDELKGRVAEHLRLVKHGGFVAQLWASIQVGRSLLAIKQRCRHGEFDSAKIAEGLNKIAAHRYMTLANSPKVSHCETFEHLVREADRNEWRSMRHILDEHGLSASKKPVPIAGEIVEAIEDIALCRYDDGYLFCWQNTELSMGTKNPGIARAYRDFAIRLLGAFGLLTDDEREKLEPRTEGDKPNKDAMLSGGSGYLWPKGYADLLAVFSISHKSEPMPLDAVEFSGPFCPWEKEAALRDIETLMTRRRRVHLVYTRKSITVCYYAQRAAQTPPASDPWSDHQAAAGAR